MSDATVIHLVFFLQFDSLLNYMLSKTLLDTLTHLYRHLNWTLKSLKVSYGRDNEQLPLKSFTPELSFPQSSLELLLEG